MLLKLGLALCIVAVAQAASCPDYGKKVLGCAKDLANRIKSDSSVAVLCGSIRNYLCCFSDAIDTCDADTQKIVREQYKSYMDQLTKSQKSVSYCNIDLPNALDKTKTTCSGTKWIGPTGSSPPRAAISSVLCLCMFLVLKVFL